MKCAEECICLDCSSRRRSIWYMGDDNWTTEDSVSAITMFGIAALSGIVIIIYSWRHMP